MKMPPLILRKKPPPLPTFCIYIAINFSNSSTTCQSYIAIYILYTNQKLGETENGRRIRSVVPTRRRRTVPIDRRRERRGRIPHGVVRRFLRAYGEVGGKEGRGGGGRGGGGWGRNMEDGGDCKNTPRDAVVERASRAVLGSPE